MLKQYRVLKKLTYYFEVCDLDLNVTQVGHDGTAQNFRPIPTYQRAKYQIDPSAVST